jgi:hypothetical protein
MAQNAKKRKKLNEAKERRKKKSQCNVCLAFRFLLFSNNNIL